MHAFQIPHTTPKSNYYVFFPIDSGCAGSPKFLNTNPFSFPVGNFYQKYLSLPNSLDNSFDVKSRTNSSLQVYTYDIYMGLPVIILRLHSQAV